MNRINDAATSLSHPISYGGENASDISSVPLWKQGYDINQVYSIDKTFA